MPPAYSFSISVAGKYRTSAFVLSLVPVKLYRYKCPLFTCMRVQLVFSPSTVASLSCDIKSLALHACLRSDIEMSTQQTL
jgi:hypothetical protein